MCLRMFLFLEVFMKRFFHYFTKTEIALWLTSVLLITVYQELRSLIIGKKYSDGIYDSCVQFGFG